MVKYLALISLVSLTACGINAQKPKADSSVTTEATTELKVIQLENGWGYDIYRNGKKYIHQTTIPSVPGTSGFSSKEDARKVGELVVEKINNNIMPPSVTPEELKSLKIKMSDSGK